VFRARYGLSPYITQIILLIKSLISLLTKTVSFLSYIEPVIDERMSMEY